MSLPHYLTSPATAVIAALLLDALLGEPKRWHPLVGFGRLAHRIEAVFNHQLSVSFPLGKRGSEGDLTVLDASPQANPACPPFTKGGVQHARTVGLLAWVLLLSPFIMLAYWLQQTPLAWFADVLLLYFSIGAHSLFTHARQIHTPLQAQQLPQARQALSMIVSRDTAQLSETQIASATVESVLENGNDAIFGAIFWFLLLGGAGAVMFRLANTLDAMWGYKNVRFLHFGWAAARLDDALNWIPARLTALSYALLGNTKTALQCWRNQAPLWESPNAGPVMAAGAGALDIQLGGAAIYHGAIEQRPALGAGNLAQSGDILRAIALVKHTILLWCAVILVGAYFA